MGISNNSTESNKYCDCNSDQFGHNRLLSVYNPDKIQRIDKNEDNLRLFQVLENWFRYNDIKNSWFEWQFEVEDSRMEYLVSTGIERRVKLEC